MGHTVFAFQETEATAIQLLLSAQKSDLFIWVHTHGWETEDINDVLVECKRCNVPTVGYHLDLWKGIQREADLKTDPYWGIEYFFTVDKLFVDDLRRRGIKAYYLPAGVFEGECYQAEPDYEKFPFDVVFTGSKKYHPEWGYRTQLIDWLQDVYGSRFGLFGNDGLRVVRGHELNVLYATAKIVVGDTLCQGFSYPYYYSDRLFEVPGRGGFLIFPYIQGIDKMFRLTKYGSGNAADTSRTELITYPFDNFSYLKYLIDYYIFNTNEREEIRDRGLKRALRDHTYTKRWQFILDTIKNEKRGNKV